MHVETLGDGPRVVLVHGSMSGPRAWTPQRPLADRFRLEIVARPGFPPNSPEQRIDFERDAPLVAEQLGEGAHLVGHSYGGVICLLAAALRPDAVRSLTVIEPPAFGVARGHPAVDDFVAAAERYWAEGPGEPIAFAEGFLALVGSSARLPPEAEQAARGLMVERLPSEAEIPLAALGRAPFPKLVVSGAHHPAFDAVCDVLERELPAERAVISGFGHSITAAGDELNRVLEDFLSRSERRR
jgi:pimeloyl-ACP methyl ester carboxylesterase